MKLGEHDDLVAHGEPVEAVAVFGIDHESCRHRAWFIGLPGRVGRVGECAIDHADDRELCIHLIHDVVV
jgi:hypothetical protein